MSEYNPDDLIGRTFLLTPNQKGERHRASIKQKVIEISEKLDEDKNAVIDNINFVLDVGQGRSQAIISYNQVLNYLKRTIKRMSHCTSSEPSHTPHAKSTISNSQHHHKQEANSTTAHSNDHADHSVTNTLPTYASNSEHHMLTEKPQPLNQLHHLIP